MIAICMISKGFFLLPVTPAFWHVQHNLDSSSNGLLYTQKSELFIFKSFAPVNMHLGCLRNGKWENNVLPVTIQSNWPTRWRTGVTFSDTQHSINVEILRHFLWQENEDKSSKTSKCMNCELSFNIPVKRHMNKDRAALLLKITPCF